MQPIMKKKHRILIIEDETDIAKLLQLHLSESGDQVVTEGNGLKALSIALEGGWDLILLDLHLPDLDGLEICRHIRAKSEYVPIMMLTSRSSELDRVLGLELGADDYLPKPFSVLELQARVKALLRRVQAMKNPGGIALESNICVKGLVMNREQRKTLKCGSPVDLTAKEFDLLWFFASHPGKVFQRVDLLKEVWGYGHDGYEHTVNSHINRLRAKIESDPAHPEFIQTVWGVGYRFDSSTE